MPCSKAFRRSVPSPSHAEASQTVPGVAAKQTAIRVACYLVLCWRFPNQSSANAPCGKAGGICFKTAQPEGVLMMSSNLNGEATPFTALRQAWVVKLSTELHRSVGQAFGKAVGTFPEHPHLQTV